MAQVLPIRFQEHLQVSTPIGLLDLPIAFPWRKQFISLHQGDVLGCRWCISLLRVVAFIMALRNYSGDSCLPLTAEAPSPRYERPVLICSTFPLDHMVWEAIPKFSSFRSKLVDKHFTITHIYTYKL